VHLYIFSCFFLIATCVICLVGLSTPRFDDNLFQNVGMGLLAIGCGSRVPDLWGNENLPLDWFMIHAGIGLFAIGVFFKVYLRERAAGMRAFMQSIWRPPVLASIPLSDDER
jgi:hypothetical protein